MEIPEPKRWPLLMLLFWGTLYALTVPLFESPDEPAHFARAYGITEGQFVLKDSSRQLSEYIRDTLKKRKHHAQIVSIMDQLLNTYPDRVRLIAPNTALYSPVPYLFHALVIKIITSFGDSTGLLTLSVYLCRLTSLLLFVLVLSFALRISPLSSRPVFWIIATPMALSQAAMVNVDFVILATTVILVTASLGNLEFRLFIGAATVSGYLLMMTKPPFAPLLILPAFSILFVQRISKWKRFIALCGVLLIPVAGAAVWNSEVAFQTTMKDYCDQIWKYTGCRISPLDQLSVIKSHPLHFIRVVWNTLCIHGGSYFHQFVGVLGWQSIPIPLGAVFLWTCFAIPAIGICAEIHLTSQTRFILGIGAVAVSILVVISVSASAYMVWMPISADWINLQGRYFHPAAVACFSGMALILPGRLRNELVKISTGWLIIIACVIHAISLMTVWQYYNE